MTAAVIFILYAVSAGNLPDLTALGSFESRQACLAAAQTVEKAVGGDEPHKALLCVGSDSLEQLARDSGAAH